MYVNMDTPRYPWPGSWDWIRLYIGRGSHYPFLGLDIFLSFSSRSPKFWVNNINSHNWILKVAWSGGKDGILKAG